MKLGPVCSYTVTALYTATVDHDKRYAFYAANLYIAEHVEKKDHGWVHLQ